MKTAIETLEFPSEIKQKIKMKASLGNLKVDFINGHLIKFDKTNLSVKEPFKIIVNNNKQYLVGYLYDDTNKVYIPSNNLIISITKFISIINQMNNI